MWNEKKSNKKTKPFSTLDDCRCEGGRKPGGCGTNKSDLALIFKSKVKNKSIKKQEYIVENNHFKRKIKYA